MRALALITIAMLLAAGATQTHAHRAPGGWDYPFECCSEADCAQIDVSEVRETPAGFVVTIRAGPAPDVGDGAPPDSRARHPLSEGPALTGRVLSSLHE
jgi:hypothetical protein